MKRHLMALAFTLAACSHDAKPASSEPPPLPPASGTPIGYLIDDATDLGLDADQLAKLHEIDDHLTAELTALDGKAKHAQAASSGDSQPPPSPMGRHHGGRHGGAGGHRQAAGSAAPANTTAAVTGNERVADVKAAVDEALAALQPAQRDKARKVLSDRGVDTDAALAEPAAEPDEPPEP